MQALKGTSSKDRYELFWSPRPEFVRAAARFGATIIPIAGVGCEENAAAVTSANTLKAIGGLLSRGRGQGSAGGESGSGRESAQNGSVKRARRGVNDLSGQVNDAGDLLPSEELTPVRRSVLVHCEMH